MTIIERVKEECCLGFECRFCGTRWEQQTDPDIPDCCRLALEVYYRIVAEEAALTTACAGHADRPSHDDINHPSQLLHRRHRGDRCHRGLGPRLPHGQCRQVRRPGRPQRLADQ